MQNSFVASPIVENYLAPPDPHEAERIKPFGLLALVVSVITLFLESWLWYSVIQDHIGLGLGIFVHLVLSLAVLVVFVLSKPLPSDRLFLALLTITNFALGPAGSGGVTLCLLLSLWYNIYATSFSEWFSTIFPSLKLTSAEITDQDLRTGRDEAGKHYDVEPFMDVIRYGTDDQKRRALSKITSHFTPGFAPVLQRALGDKSNMIRVQAATAISIIENRFQDRLMKLSKLHKKYPEDMDVTLALANFHDDYSFTGILDSERERENRNQACRLYEAYLKERPTDGVVRTRFGRLMLRMGDIPAAITSFEQAYDTNHTPTRAAWLAEAYFRQGRYKDLRALAQELESIYPDVLARMEDSAKHSLRSWIGLHPSNITTQPNTEEEAA